MPSLPSESGQSDGARNSSDPSADAIGPCKTGQFGPEIAADLSQIAVVADQPIERVSAPRAPLQVLLESRPSRREAGDPRPTSRSRFGSQGFNWVFMIGLVDDRRLVAELLDPSPQAGQDPAPGDVDGPD